MANHTTGAERHNARQDKIWEQMKRLEAEKLMEPIDRPRIDWILRMIASLNKRELKKLYSDLGINPPS